MRLNFCIGGTKWSLVYKLFISCQAFFVDKLKKIKYIGIMEEKTKICSKCGEEKTLDLFYNNKSKKDGKESCCKNCSKISSNKYYNENTEKALISQSNYQKSNKEKIATRKKIYADKNKDHIKEYQKEYNIINNDKLKKQKSDYYQENKEKISEQKKEYGKKYRSDPQVKKNKQANQNNRLKNDISFKILRNLRNRIHYAVVLEGYKKSDKTIKLTGCTKVELLNHLENTSPEEFNWDIFNNGNWVVDHIIPCASYDFKVEKNQYKCFNYRNLRILSKNENLKKSNKIDWNLIHSHNLYDLLPASILLKNCKITKNS